MIESADGKEQKCPDALPTLLETDQKTPHDQRRVDERRMSETKSRKERVHWQLLH